MKSILQYKNILAGLIIIVIFGLIMKNMWEKHTAVIKKLEAQRLELEKGKELVTKWTAVTRQIDTLTKTFIKDTTAFKTLVEDQAKTSRINVNSLIPSKKEKDLYVEATINIKGYSNSYTDVVKFVKALEEKNIITDSLRIKADREDRDKRNIDVNFKSSVIND